MTRLHPRTVIIGLDGVPFEMLDKLSNERVMPNFQHLRQGGLFKKMESTVPEVSAVSWNSIVTGKNPGEHGVYGFTDLMKESYTLTFHNSSKLRAPTFWEQNPSRKFVVINLPAAYPAQRINGVLITGFVSPDLERAVYPKKYVNTLKSLGYRVDIDTVKARTSNLILFKQLFETMELRMKSCMKFWNEVNWDLMMIVFTGTDRLEHFLWEAYTNKHHEQHKNFLRYFEEIDKAIGTITSKMKERENLLILSDHGMEKIDTNVNLNTFLLEKGYLKIEENPRKGYNSIKHETKAFSLDPSRIYVHKKERYPRGSVTEEEEESLIREIESTLSELSWNGRRVLDRIFRKEELYEGKCFYQAPDLVLVPAKGFNLRARLFRKETFENDQGLTGKHTQQNAFLYVKGFEAEALIPRNLSVENVLSIVSSLGEK